MTSRNTKVFSRDASGVTFADPLSVTGFSVRFKTTSARKTIDGLLLQNSATEIIVQDTNKVSVGDKTVSDPLSIRVRVSGAVNSKARVIAIMNSIAAQMPAWAAEDVLSGFEPVTVPLNPI